MEQNITNEILDIKWAKTEQSAFQNGTQHGIE